MSPAPCNERSRSVACMPLPACALFAVDSHAGAVRSVRCERRRSCAATLDADSMDSAASVAVLGILFKASARSVLRLSTATEKPLTLRGEGPITPCRSRPTVLGNRSVQERATARGGPRADRSRRESAAYTRTAAARYGEAPRRSGPRMPAAPRLPRRPPNVENESSIATAPARPRNSQRRQQLAETGRSAPGSLHRRRGAKFCRPLQRETPPPLQRCSSLAGDG